jgi:hypothetical protein
LPIYVYRVKHTDQRYEVRHSMAAEPKTWGDLCQLGELDPDQHPAEAAVERLILPVATQVGQFTSDLKNSGFQRLEKRSDGSYENVTAPKGGSDRIIDPRSL